jgi:hypothetical protein
VRRPLYILLCVLPFGGVLLSLVLSCNSAASGTIQLITGEETDTFTQTPVPTQIIVQAEEDGGPPTTLATAAYPTDTIDLGNQDQDAVASLDVEATDSNGNELIYGASVPLQYGALDGQTLPIFVQRVGQNARLSNFPSGDTRQAPTMGLLSDRFLIIAGGLESTTSLTTEIYDFAQFNLLTPPPTMPIVPASMAIVSTVGLLVDTAGDGWYYDFSGSTSNYSFTAPTDANNFTLADVAGGQVIYDADDGYVFIVGATRTTGTATQAVLMINTNDTSNSTYETGNLSWLSLTDARLGASAAWVSPQGLVVAGGNPTAAGVEVIDVDANSTVGSELGYPADPSIGAGMTALDESGDMLIAGGILPAAGDGGAGGDAGVRAIKLGCAGTMCMPAPWGPNNGALPIAVTSAFAFTVSPAYAFLVGSEPATGQTPGLTHTFTLTTAGATEVPTKVAHTNASALLSPMGSVIFYGGANGEIESFTPAPQGFASGGGVDGG